MSFANMSSFGFDTSSLHVHTQIRDVVLNSQSLTDVVNKLHSVYPHFALATSAGALKMQTVLPPLSWSNVLNILLLLLVAANLKCFPLVYHLRILNGVRHMLKSQRSPKPLTPQQLFQPLITSSRAPLMEIDVYGHKNNNTYFTDHDVARTHLLSTMFAKGIEKVRGSVTMNGLSGKKTSGFTIPLGAVCCSFRRELKPYEPYDMWTRVLTWDEKWLYVVTHFVKKGAKIEPEEFSLYQRQNSLSGTPKSSRQSSVVGDRSARNSVDGGLINGTSSAIAATALSKVVFKDNRITIAPVVMLEAAGLLPAKTSNIHQERLATAQIRANDDVEPLEAVDELDVIGSSTADSSSGLDTSPADGKGQLYQHYLRDEIEAERLRGLHFARMLAGQSELENELKNEVALGRHHDGYGIEGVVATLMQLGGLSNYQLV